MRWLRGTPIDVNYDFRRWRKHQAWLAQEKCNRFDIYSIWYTTYNITIKLQYCTYIYYIIEKILYDVQTLYNSLMRVVGIYIYIWLITIFPTTIGPFMVTDVYSCWNPEISPLPGKVATRHLLLWTPRNAMRCRRRFIKQKCRCINYNTYIYIYIYIYVLYSLTLDFGYVQSFGYTKK